MHKIRGNKQQVTTVYYTNTTTANILVYFFAIFIPTYSSGVTRVPYQIINYTHCLDSKGSEFLARKRKNPRNSPSGMTKE